MRSIQFQIIAPDHEDLHRLIDKLDRELASMYPAEGIFGLDFTDPAVQEMTFCVAYVGATAAGCGAFKPMGGNVAELKRFFVEPSFRGSGIGSLLLRYLEERARDASIGTMRLETGPKQLAAIGMYKKCGYRPIETYGPYVGCPYSYCMEKTL